MLMGLVLGIGVLRLMIPAVGDSVYSRVPPLRADCEVLFFGPSYVQSQVYPEVVDSAAAESGRPVKSCKFARTHLKGFEMKRELEIILGQPWAKLRLVVFDVTLGPDVWFKPENRFKPRVVRWHTLEFLPWFVAHLDGQGDRGVSLPERFNEHLRHVIANTLLVGQGAEHLAAMGKPDARALSSRTSKNMKKQKVNMKKLARLNKKRLARLARRKEMGAPRIEWILELRSLVRSHGVEGDALIAPVWGGQWYPRKNFPAQDPPVLHAFNDPKKYPSLYVVGAHKEDEHLTYEGSVEYSKVLGREIASRMKELE